MNVLTYQVPANGDPKRLLVEGFLLSRGLLISGKNKMLLMLWEPHILVPLAIKSNAGFEIKSGHCMADKAVASHWGLACDFCF